MGSVVRKEELIQFLSGGVPISIESAMGLEPAACRL